MGRYKYFEATSTVEDLIKGAHSDMEELTEEMATWRDNMDGTPAENAPSFAIVSETADTLENQEDPTDNMDDLLPDILSTNVIWQDVKVTSGRQKTPSRAVRCSQVSTRFTAAATAIREWLENNDVPEPDNIEQMAETLDDIVGNIDGLEFPGMFG